jgi:hypothetical protein
MHHDGNASRTVFVAVKAGSTLFVIMRKALHA